MAEIQSLEEALIELQVMRREQRFVSGLQAQLRGTLRQLELEEASLLQHGHKAGCGNAWLTADFVRASSSSASSSSRARAMPSTPKASVLAPVDLTPERAVDQKPLAQQVPLEHAVRKADAEETQLPQDQVEDFQMNMIRDGGCGEVIATAAAGNVSTTGRAKAAPEWKQDDQLVSAAAETLGMTSEAAAFAQQADGLKKRFPEESDSLHGLICVETTPLMRRSNHVGATRATAAARGARVAAAQPARRARGSGAATSRSPSDSRSRSPRGVGAACRAGA